MLVSLSAGILLTDWSVVLIFVLLPATTSVLLSVILAEKSKLTKLKIYEIKQIKPTKTDQISCSRYIDIHLIYLLIYGYIFTV